MYRVRTVFSGVQGAPWLNTLYFQDSGGTAQQAATAAGAFWNSVDTYIYGGITWTTEADVVSITASSGALAGVTATTPVTGTGGGGSDPLPYATQGLVRWRTGVVVGTRELRGKTFIPGLTETGVTAALVTAAVVTAVNTAAATLISDPNSILVAWHRPSAPGALDGVSWNVATGQMAPGFAVLRSRRD